MSNPFTRARFRLSGENLSHLPADSGRELAFAGRSNAGKSSAINTLTGIGGLARTSRTPGRTQHLVVFDLDEDHRLVDLPGYGYAKVPRAMREHWGRELGRYLNERASLAGLVVIMDSRHPLKDNDWLLLEACASRGLPALALLTKADKLNRSDQQRALQQVRKELAAAGAGDTAVRLFSSSKPERLDRLRGELADWLWRQVPPPASVATTATAATPGAAESG
ncbi:MAG: ribosome biogenesis GTP-binding protein YihA/YsxC [Xanthomonadales bacterium]|nr:ribosome biogenesis GTP-binding protein YihA/YsxC [Xanthomonadales bacterium]